MSHDLPYQSRPPEAAPKSSVGGLIGWAIFGALATMLFMLLRKDGQGGGWVLWLVLLVPLGFALLALALLVLLAVANRAMGSIAGSTYRSRKKLAERPAPHQPAAPAACKMLDRKLAVLLRDLAELGFRPIEDRAYSDASELWFSATRFSRVLLDPSGATVCEVNLLLVRGRVSWVFPWLRTLRTLSFDSYLSDGSLARTHWSRTVMVLTPGTLDRDELAPRNAKLPDVVRQHQRRLAELASNGLTVVPVHSAAELHQAEADHHQRTAQWLRARGYVTVDDLRERIAQLPLKRQAREWAELKALRAADGFETVCPVLPAK